jgi:hypothetical protein
MASQQDKGAAIEKDKQNKSKKCCVESHVVW